MTTPSILLFSVALLFYAFAWVYIRQLVRDVNRQPTEQQISVWRWNKAWGRHRLLFPQSQVRKRLTGCIAITVILGLIAFVIEARLIIHRH